MWKASRLASLRAIAAALPPTARNATRWRRSDIRNSRWHRQLGLTGIGAESVHSLADFPILCERPLCANGGQLLRKSRIVARWSRGQEETRHVETSNRICVGTRDESVTPLSRQACLSQDCKLFARCRRTTRPFHRTTLSQRCA